jgi:hypothetical protein
MMDQVSKIGVKCSCGEVTVFLGYRQVDNFIILCEKCGKVYTVRMDNATGKYVVSHNIDIVCTMV